MKLKKKMGAFDKLLEQIDAFIRKYYKNQLVKGFLLFVLFSALCFLAVNLLEYVGRFNSIVRAVLFFGGVTTIVYLFIRYFLIPLSKLYSFGKRINRQQASRIIGDFFPDVKDSLLNTLQLQASINDKQNNFNLLLASVEQRSSKLSAIPFSTAVDISKNKKYLKFVIPVFLIVLAIAAFVPKIFTEPTDRLFNYNQAYVEPAPFDFILVNQSLKVEEGAALQIDLKVVPKENNPLPNKVFIKSGNGVFLMEKSSKNEMTFVFPKVIEDLGFVFEAEGFESKSYLIDVVGKANFTKFNAKLIYPEYLDRKDEFIENAADFVIPEGTKIEWDLITKNSKALNIQTPDSNFVFESKGLKWSKVFVRNEKLLFTLESNTIDSKVENEYAVEVIKDAYPSILVSELKDSLNSNRSLFSGKVSDDIGIRSVNFVYSIKGSNGGVKKASTIVPGIGRTEGIIDMSFDFSKLSLTPKDEVEYYFEVIDNDRVNGFKRVKSAVFSLKLPSVDKLNEERSDELKNTQEKLNQALKDAQEFKEKVKDLKKSMLDKSSSKWSKKKQIQNLQDEQNKLNKTFEGLKKNIQESQEKQEQFGLEDQELLEKQELIEDLLDDLMDDELKDLLDEIEELMDKNAMSEEKELSEELEKSSEELNEELDRALEQLKQLKINEDLNKLEDKLNELAERQEELSETEEESEKDKQKELKDEFEKIEEKLEDVLKENGELERPMDLEDMKDDREEVKEDMKSSEEEMEKGKSSKTNEKQKSASDKMKEMAAKLNGMQSKSNQEQKGEDMEMLRAVLKSLVTLSLNQEDNMDDFNSINVSDPDYIKLGRDQRKIIDDLKPVKDSLKALAKRVPKVAKFIDKELRDIDMNYNALLEDVDERKLNRLTVKQQYVMTSYNNLALFLNESLQQMQQEMQQQQKEGGDGSCDNPGGKGKGSKGNMPMNSMKDMLKQQLESLKKGNNPGGKKPGDNSGKGEGFKMGPKGAAQMAAQQDAIRRQLESLKNELNKAGKKEGDVLNPLLEELEKQQEDLINKKWDSDLIDRQEEILTRLLESENALKERGLDEKRESNEGKNDVNSNPIDFLEYKKLKEKQIELLRSLNPELERYYKNKANEYFNRVN